MIYSNGLHVLAVYVSCVRAGDLIWLSYHFAPRNTPHGNSGFAFPKEPCICGLCLHCKEAVVIYACALL